MNIRKKPRIYRLRSGLWICATPGEHDCHIGNTPAEAYAYWRRNAGRTA
jgi:hypothetical protein